jgi:S1-C subfamily serine protease
VPAIQDATSPPVPPLASPPPGDESTIAEAAVQATVRIECDDGIGAGAIIHPDGLVLTARHVVRDGGMTCREVAVRLADGKRLRGIVVRSHWPLDFALLWLDRPGPFAWLPVGDATALRVAEPLIAVGHPSALTNTVTRGVVSNPRSHYWGVECLQTDTAMAEGNSGGPVLNLRGEIVAVSAWQVEDVDSGKFAVPVDWYLDDIAEVVSLGRSGSLKARYCLACGHLETKRRLRWCPVCGADAVVHGRPRR